ncbi:MAG: folate-binding protein YgfZ [Acidobacteria bacterium]|nr:folate-binding protein YgfZ [Acidobacteriota bacterium]
MMTDRISSPPTAEVPQDETRQWHALREGAVLARLADRAQIALTGADRHAFLQGLLTNDIASLASGTGCYAAWLTPQGRMLTDLHVLEAGDMMLLDVPLAEAGPTLARLDQFLFGEDVQFADLSGNIADVWVHGPAAASLLDSVLTGTAGLAQWEDYRNARVEFGGEPVVVARISQLGVPGFVAYTSLPVAAALADALSASGAVRVSASIAEASRIEAGYPLYGVDMTEDTIPLEAGIEDRALSFSKGCYVGQEVVVRILHRGHGRVARRLVGLRVAGAVPHRGDRIHAAGGDGPDIGWVTSAASSPALGAVALGYVHRDHVEAGSAVRIVTTGGEVAATVTTRPMPRGVQ